MVSQTLHCRLCVGSVDPVSALQGNLNRGHFTRTGRVGREPMIPSQLVSWLLKQVSIKDTRDNDKILNIHELLALMSLLF